MNYNKLNDYISEFLCGRYFLLTHLIAGTITKGKYSDNLITFNNKLFMFASLTYFDNKEPMTIKLEAVQ